MSSSDHITLLQSAGPMLAKAWLADGSISSYESAKQFKPRQVEVAGIEALSRLLFNLESERNVCLIRGAFVGYDVANSVAIEQSESLKAGYVLRQRGCFKDQSLHWLMLDVDHYQPKTCDSVLEPEKAAEEFIANCLPKEFRHISFHWSLSGSAGHPRYIGSLKMHLHFWLREPRTCAELAAWASTMPRGHIDGSLYSPVQVHYTAAPVFADNVADPVPVRSGFYQGLFDNTLDLSIESTTLAKARGRDINRRPLVDPRKKPSLIGAFCRAYSPSDLHTLLPDQFRVGKRAGHFTWVGHSEDGVFITDCGLGLVSAHDTAPTGRNRPCNIYDAVRLHLFGGLDSASPTGCRMIDRPSVKAMNDWIGEHHPRVLDDVLRPSSSPEEDFGYFDAENLAPSDLCTAGANAKVSKSSSLVVLRPSDLRNRPPAKWLVDRLLPDRGIVSLVGDSNVGKSFYALNASLAIARGEPWFGKAVMQGSVVYVAAEGGYGFGRRLDAYAKHHDLDLDDLPFGFIDNGLDLCSNGKDTEEIIGAVQDFQETTGQPIRLVVLDTMARMMNGGDENSSVDMGHVLAMVSKISQATKSVVLLVHHVGKDAQRGARGHSSFRAALDTQLLVTKKADRCIVKIDKQRDGPTDLEFAYRLETVDLGISNESLESETSAVLVPIDCFAGFDEAPKKMGKWESIALQGVQSTDSWAKHRRVLRVEVAQQVEQQHQAHDLGLPPTWCKMLDRGLEDMVKSNVLAEEGHFLVEGLMFPTHLPGQVMH